jgi:hypothetical protein
MVACFPLFNYFSSIVIKSSFCLIQRQSKSGERFVASRIRLNKRTVVSDSGRKVSRVQLSGKSSKRIASSEDSLGRFGSDQSEKRTDWQQACEQRLIQ